MDFLSERHGILAPTRDDGGKPLLIQNRAKLVKRFEHRLEEGDARQLLPLHDGERRRLVAQILGELLFLDIDVDARADDDVVDAVKLGAHLRQDARELLPLMQDVVRPLDLGSKPETLHRHRHGDGGKKRAFRRFLRQDVRTQDHREPDTLAPRRKERSLQSSAPLALCLRHDDGPRRSALASELLGHMIRRIDLFEKDDVLADEARLQAVLDLPGQEAVGRLLQRVAASRPALDAIACVAKLLDVLPNGSARDAQPLGDLLPRKVLFARLAQKL